MDLEIQIENFRTINHFIYKETKILFLEKNFLPIINLWNYKIVGINC
jgi:hypothetical protein